MKNNNIKAKKTNSQNKKQGFTWNNVYYMALMPLLSIVAYLFLMMCGLIDDSMDIMFSGLVLLFVSLIWGACGYLFGNTRTTMLTSILIANAVPILTTGIYIVLYIVSTLTGSQALSDTGFLIGGLGTGLFGFAGMFFFALAPFELEFVEVFINFIFHIITFVVGYSIGASAGKKNSILRAKNTKTKKK